MQVSYDYTARGFIKQLKLANAATVSPLAGREAPPAPASTSPPAAACGRPASSTPGARASKAPSATASPAAPAMKPHAAARLALSAGTGTGAAAKNVLDFGYAWDSLNNLVYRADNIGDAVAGAVTENFFYEDALARLTQYTVNAPAVPSGSRTVTLQYNALGMLLSKSDVGTYTYPSSWQCPAPCPGHPGTPWTAARPASATTLPATSSPATASTATSPTPASTCPTARPASRGAPGGAYGGTAQYTWAYDESHTRIKEVRTITGGTMAGTRTLWYLHPDNAGPWASRARSTARRPPTAANPAQTTNRHF